MVSLSYKKMFYKERKQMDPSHFQEGETQEEWPEKRSTAIGIAGGLGSHLLISGWTVGGENCHSEPEHWVFSMKLCSSFGGVRAGLSSNYVVGSSPFCQANMWSNRRNHFCKHLGLSRGTK